MLSPIGGFSSLWGIDCKSYPEPVLVSSTDGVGTKVLIANQMKKFNTIGIDLVAMCVNDILVCGARPLFFLDYYATGKLNKEQGLEIIDGIVAGCHLASCSLVGGETAEMPDVYRPEDFDLAGFVVGLLNKPDLVTGESIQEGDVIVGLESSGFHSNGYSLLRKTYENMDLRQPFGSLSIDYPGMTLGDILLMPTIIYVKDVTFLRMNNVVIKGMAHITGGGLLENIPRVLPDGLGAVIESDTFRVPNLFRVTQEVGNIPTEEMFRTFNCGIGYVFIVSSKDADKITDWLPYAHKIGNIVADATKTTLVRLPL
jgi:phosphoribosylformylglycinamidine cyclo-ligase